MYGGKITGNETTAVIGNNSNNKVYINMYGGEIIGNRSDAEVCGSGVFIGHGSHFNMYGGRITGNESVNDGGGVYISPADSTYGAGTFTMSGGEISGNKTNKNGGGVYAGGVFSISGSAAIDGNTVNGSNNNVYLPNGNAVTIIGEPLNIIGVTTAIAPADGKPVKFAVSGNNYTIKESDTAHFISDAGSVYQTVYKNDGAMYLSLLPHEHPVIPDGIGDVILESVGDENELREIANTGSGQYYLTEDIKLTGGTWTPADGTVLDLNGHSITADGEFDTISVDGNVNFTLTDCKGGNENYGSITHQMKNWSNKYLGRGVNVSPCGRFTMYGGSINGNWANNTAGAGVYISSGAYFTMLGGEITNNLVPAGMSNNGGGIWTEGKTTIGGSACILWNTALTGGGVYVSGGTLTLEGNAKVTGNTAINRRNGIFVSTNGKLCVSGSVQVTENSDGNNVYLDGTNSVNPISVAGELTDGAAIGVTLPENILKSINDNHFVTIAAAETNGRINGSCFINENGGAYSIIVSKDGKTVQLGTHGHEWKYTLSSNGTAITAKCSNTNCTADGGSMSIKIPDESTLTYDGKEKTVITEGQFNTGAVPEITYKVYKNGKFTALPKGETVPVNAGRYQSTLTVEGVTAVVEYTVQKATLQVSDFNVILPTDLTYDGTAKTASVTSDKIDSSYIEVSYWSKNEQGMFGYEFETRNAGTYFVRIAVSSNPNYAEIVNRITDEENWKFTISPSTEYTVHIPEKWNTATDVIEGATFRTALASITQNGTVTVTAAGVNNETIYGDVSWYTDKACTKPVNKSAVIDGTAGTTVKLYWKFVFGDEYPNGNYKTEDKTGSVDITIADGPEQKLFFYDINDRAVTDGFAKYGDSPIRLQAQNIEGTAGGAFTYDNSNPEVATIAVDANDNITITICGVGTTDITATAAMVPGRYAKTTMTYTLTVNKGEWKQENVFVSTPADYTYNEKPQTPSLYGYSGDYSAVTYLYSAAKVDIGSSEWQKWDIENPTQLDAGTYYMYAQIAATKHYYSFVTKVYTFKVLKAYPTCKTPIGVTARYGQKLSEIQLTNPEGNTPGEWSWINGDELVGAVSDKPKTFKAMFTPKDTNNYEIEDNSKIAVTVNKADAPAADAAALTVYNGVEKTYEIALPKLPKLPNSCEYGTITYGIPKFTGDIGYYSEGAKVENGKLSLPILANTVTKEGNIGEVKIPVITDNYENIILTVNVNAKNQIVPTGNPTLSDNGTITYGDAIRKITLSSSLYDKENDVNVEGTFEWITPDGIPNAGICEAGWRFTPSNKYTDMYAPVIGKAKIKVNKAEVKFTNPSAKEGLEYRLDNEPQTLHTKGNVTVGGTMKYTTVNPKIAADSDWSETPVTARDAGDYAVYYKVFGDDNHLDSDYGTITCSIAQYELTYEILCSPKIYDGTTKGYPEKIESIKFHSKKNPAKEITLAKDTDYTIDSIEYLSKNVGGNLGDETVEAKAVISLKDTAANNYKINGGTAYGRITPAPFKNIGDFDSYTQKICYNDISENTITASYFGAPNIKDYVIVSDKSGDGDANICRINLESESFVFAVKSGLGLDDVGKSYTVKLKIYSKDYNYCTDELSFTVEIADKGTPVLSVKDITAVYNGKSVPNSSIDGTATVDGHKIDGDFYFINGAPVNVADSGTYDVGFRPSSPYYYDDVYTPVKVTISEKEVTAKVTVDGTYIYNGKEIEPSVITVMDGDTVIPDTEYTKSFEDNVKAGKAKVIITNAKGGNYIVNGIGEFGIEKANITVKPKDISKVYGSAPEFKLESKSSLITEEELEKSAKSAKFTSEGAEKTAKVIDGGYEITAVLTVKETDNLILSVLGTGTLTVVPKKLDITVNDVSRIYGDPNPELSVSYDSFIEGEDESILGGTLTLNYNADINETAAVGLYEKATTASGLTSENYDIHYFPGNVTITKIPVSVSAGTTGRTYLNIVFDKRLEGLSAENFVVKDSEGNTITVTNVTESSDGKTYTLSGSFKVGKEHTVKVVLSGTAAEATHQLTADEFVITPTRTSIGGGGSASVKYTVSFDTNGGNELSKQTVTKNTAITEPTAPTKEGFDFAGWYTDKELNEKYDFSAKVTKNITLYAAWTEKDNSVNQIILTIGEKDALVFGNTKTNDVAPKIVNDRTMLPARFVAENLGADVSWDGEKELVTIKGKNLKTSEDITILIYIGLDIAYVNGKEIKLDSAAFVENDRIYTPVRFISEELGASVEWVEAEQKVVITK